MKFNNFKVKSLHLLIGSVSAMMLSSLGDFQNVDIYQAESKVNSWMPSIHVIKEFDRYKKEIPDNWQKISFIQQSNPWLKISLALTSVGLGVASLIIHGQEIENQDIEEYEKTIEKDKRRAIADDKRARFEIYLDQKSEIEQVKDIQELMKNDPIAREILEHRQKIELGYSGDDNPEDDYIPEHMIPKDFEIPDTPPSPQDFPVSLPDLEESEEEPKNKNKTQWITEKQITKIKILLESGLSLSESLKQVIPEFKPGHPNWDEIKKELFDKLI